jgi:hypothetical protein
MTSRLRRLLPLTALAVAASGLAACAGGGLSGGRVVVDDINPLYSSVEFSSAADGRDLRTTVQGNPFGTPGFDQAVAQIMTATYVGPKTRFTPTPGPSAKHDYFVALAVNPQPDVVSGSLCNGQPVTTAPAQRPIVIRATFCVAGRDASSVSAYLDQASGPTDPKFVDTIRQLTIQLFPYR